MAEVSFQCAISTGQPIQYVYFYMLHISFTCIVLSHLKRLYSLEGLKHNVVMKHFLKWCFNASVQHRYVRPVSRINMEKTL